ncbi:MAG TPA: hypothetical protein DGT23_34290 [Micromonosporaceae bacterium]|nr:hypothetical protein [Micromonosporaceae bacterium]
MSMLAISRDSFAGLERVNDAVASLCALGDLTRRRARMLLERRPEFAGLTQNERREVLERFPAIDGHAWWPSEDIPNWRYVWRCHCGETAFQPFGTGIPKILFTHTNFSALRDNR